MVNPLHSQSSTKASSLRPVVMGRNLKGLIESRLGQMLQIKILKSSLDGKRALLQMAGQKFEALVEGKALHKGQILTVLLARRGEGFEFISLPSSLPGLSEGSALFATIAEGPPGLQRLFGLFALLMSGRYKSSGGTISTSLDKSQKLRSLKTMALRLQQTRPQGSLLGDFLDILLGDVDLEEILPETTLIEEWLLKSSSDQSHPQERWQLQAVLRHKGAPAYFFFHVKTSQGLQIAAAVYSPQSDFSAIALHLQIAPPAMAQKLQPYVKSLQSELQTKGIQILELQISTSSSDNMVDIKA